MEKDNLISRRNFIKSSLALTIGTLGASTVLGTPVAILEKLAQPGTLIKGVQIGVITYSYRSMPDQSVEALLKYIVNSGINAVELMGGPAERFAGKPMPENLKAVRTFGYLNFKKAVQKGKLSTEEQRQFESLKSKVTAYNKKVEQWRSQVSMDKFVQVKEMYEDQGVSIYAWKPNAFNTYNSDAEIDYAFRVAKALGAPACTAEHPGSDKQTERLGSIAARHKVYMAYHAHTQASPTLWDTALEQSKWNAINLDLGHWVAAGNPSPLPFIKKYHNRIESMHVKDRTTPKHGAKNLLWGQGDTPIIQTLQLMRDQRYAFPATVELEYKIPDNSNAVKEVSKCMKYCLEALMN